MKLTAGHDCLVAGCEGLAVFGRNSAGGSQWACRAHATQIGFYQPEAHLLGAHGIGPGATDVDRAGPPVARSRPAATLSQGRLL